MSAEVAAIVASIGSAALALIGVIVANRGQSKQLTADFEKQTALADANMKAELKQYAAVTDTKLEELSREVRDHNNFARRVPVIEEQIRVANHRIEDLERKAGA